MRERIENFVDTVRASDESVKRFWTLTFSAIAIVIVVGLWIAYSALFTLAPRIEKITSGEPNIAEEARGAGQLATIFESARGIFRGVKRAADTTNNVKIVPEDRNLIFDELKPIPPTALP